MNLIRWARELAGTHLAVVLPRRWTHVQAVAARAAEVAPAMGTGDGSVLVAAAWLHDVGYAPGAVNTGLHALDGARFLRAQGAVDERVTALVAHHSAAMLEAELRGLADQLAAEFDREVSAVADALWYCDMTTGPDGQRMTVHERFAEIRSRYGPGHVVTQFITAEPELTAAVTRTEERIADGLSDRRRIRRTR